MLTDRHSHSDGHSQPATGYRTTRQYGFNGYGTQEQAGSGDEPDVGPQQTEKKITFVFKDWASI